jgi:hypothetical protein
MVRGGGLETQEAARIVSVSAMPSGQVGSLLGMYCPLTDNYDSDLSCVYLPHSKTNHAPDRFQPGARFMGEPTPRTKQSRRSIHQLSDYKPPRTARACLSSAHRWSRQRPQAPPRRCRWIQTAETQCPIKTRCWLPTPNESSPRRMHLPSFARR